MTNQAQGPKIAVAQLAGIADVAANLDNIEAMTRDAKGQGASLIVFPEAVMFDYLVDGERLAEVAREHGSEFENGIREIARKYEIHVVAGMYAQSPTGRSDNVLLVADTHGRVAAKYQKLHLYNAFAFRESDKHDDAPLKPNFDEVCVFEAGGLNFGLLNCYDLRFPEQARVLIDKGADVLLVASGWVAGPLKELHWETLLRARAIENTCYVAGACQPAPRSVGLSMILDPMGAQIAGVAENQGLAVANVSIQRQLQVREILPCVSQRRYFISQKPTGLN
ncbi:carbon-nitrogen hydrolase family protein (plasmid) [Ralstonia sp. 25C]|uniref:carbon-nitrogen hydrolase family protein n=1 Tax=Ralstonia sp. 25C TaxID=3447363 RepID=UPI003F74F849